MMHVAYTHVLLTKASHMATPDFKETGRHNHTCTWRAEAPVTMMVVYGASRVGPQNGLFKKAHGTWHLSSPGVDLWADLMVLSTPSVSPTSSERKGDICFSLYSETEGLNESRASIHGWETISPRGWRPEIEPTSSWILAGFVSAVPQWELLIYAFQLRRIYKDFS